jgi:hypothetical protein
VGAGGAGGGVAQAVAHGGELADGLVDLFGLGREQLAIDTGLAICREHPRYLVEREARGTTERDQR